MNRWKFPSGIDLTPTGHNNTAIEMFLDDIVDSLTREILQNSLDARNPNIKSPVRVEFNFAKISNNEIPDVYAIKDALIKAKEMWKGKNNQDTLNYLSNFEKVIKQKEISILKISDYNTTGLNDNSYDSLIIGNAYSQKDNLTSAGSKGIGKAAPFAASDLRMVFYSTVPTEGTEKSAGIMNFVSYYQNKQNNQITQERASYVSENGNSMEGQFTFNFPKRNNQEYGTDLFIIGLKENKYWQTKILLSTVNNFLVSLLKNELEVIVEGKKLNSKNLYQILESLKENNMDKDERDLFENTLRYYDVLTNPNSLTFKLDKRFNKYDFIESSEDGELKLLSHDPANRKILQTRQAGMKIYERKRISGNINFSGVFQATGEKLNVFLKDMENANHNTWSPDRLNPEIKHSANNFLKDLLQWYKQMVKESYEKESSSEVEAFGVSDLLPMEKRTGENTNNQDSGIQNKIKNVLIKKMDIMSPTKDGDKEEKQLTNLMEVKEDGPGGTSGLGSNRAGYGGGNSPNREYGGGDKPGNSGGKGKEIVGENNKLVGPSKIIRIKIIDVASSKGHYRIVGIPTKNKNKIVLNLRYVGADGKSYSMELINVNSREVKAELKNNSIEVTSIKKNKIFKVDFQTKSNVRMKMEALIYEVES